MLTRLFTLSLLFCIFMLSPVAAQENNPQSAAVKAERTTDLLNPAPKYAYVFLVKGLFSATDVEQFNQEVSKNSYVLSVFTDLKENTCKLEVTSNSIEEPLKAFLLAAGKAIGRSLSVELYDGPFKN